MSRFNQHGSAVHAKENTDCCHSDEDASNSQQLWLIRFVYVIIMDGGSSVVFEDETLDEGMRYPGRQGEICRSARRHDEELLNGAGLSVCK